MYVDPTYGHYVQGGVRSESVIDGDDNDNDNGRLTRAQRDVPKAAWLSGPASNFNGASSAMVLRRGRREWLRDGGVVVALLVACLALGLALARGGGCDCPGAAGGAKAASASEVAALRTELHVLNRTLAALRADVVERGRVLDAFRTDANAELGDLQSSAAGLCDALFASRAISMSMEEAQAVGTSGARNWEAFTMNGTTYLAVANRFDGSSYNTKSRIYRHSAVSGQFDLVQELDTNGATDWEAFTINGTMFLAVANNNGGGSYNIKSRIYRYSAASGKFEVVQEVDTSGARDWEAFTMNGTAYLAVANYQNGGSSYNIKSRIYRHSTASGQFDLVQEVDTSGAADWEAFTLNGTVFLALASWFDGSNHNIKSRIYQYSAASGQFEVMQEVDTSGALDWEAFMLNGTMYLAVANHYNGGSYNIKSRIYRHSAASGQFEEMREIDTSGAIDWESFTLDGTMYLAVANFQNGVSSYNIKSRVYRHSTTSDQFEVVKEVDTSGAYDWEAFTLNGALYLAVANHFNGGSWNIESRIYSIDAPC